MKNWFIKIEFKQTDLAFTIDADGNVYDGKTNHKFIKLTLEAMDEIKDIVSRNVYMTKHNGGYYNFGSNNSILRIKCRSRKYDSIKIAGWNQTERIFNMIKDKNNWKEEF